MPKAPKFLQNILMASALANFELGQSLFDFVDFTLQILIDYFFSSNWHMHKEDFFVFTKFLKTANSLIHLARLQRVNFFGAKKNRETV